LITGVVIPTLDPSEATNSTRLAVGVTAAQTIPSFDMSVLSDLSLEGHVVLNMDNSYVLTGGSDAQSTGCELAVAHFLTSLGVEWYASDETKIPSAESADGLLPLPSLVVPNLPMEYRDNDGFDILRDADLKKNLHMAGTDPTYALPGFVHTSYSLLGSDNSMAPPTDLYSSHPEWFWPRDDPTAYGQLCWTQPDLVDFLIGQVRSFLAASPEATIISVSQNDNGNYCNTTAEWDVIQEEGSPIGPLLIAVNKIADAIKDDYPHVAVDTLAYQYTRPAPVRTVPRDNVIIRLCSIECNFAKPLTDETNAAFQKDINNWSKLTQRICIWDYITNFAGYVQPFPNWSVLAPNVRFFINNGVKGLFEEGNYNSAGGDMAEYKNYLLAKIMYNPELDEDALTADFLRNYYGSEGAAAVSTYMELMTKSVTDTDYYMGESHDWNAPFLTAEVLLKAAMAFNEVELDEGKFKDRLDVAKLPVYYVILLRWDEFAAWAGDNGVAWPVEQSMEEAFGWFEGVYEKKGVALLNEWGNDINWLKTQLGL
jgi:hypothetical protein